MKRFIAFALVLVLVLTLVATAFASVPTATVVSKYKNQKIKVGKTIKFKYKVNSKSFGYQRVGGTKYLRAGVVSYCTKGNCRVSNDLKLYFSGKGTTKTFKFRTKGAAKGKYYNRYFPIFRYSAYDSTWYYKKIKKTAFWLK